MTIGYQYFDGYPCGQCTLLRHCKDCSDPIDDAVRRKLNFLSTLQVVRTYNVEDDFLRYKNWSGVGLPLSHQSEAKE